MNYWSGVRLAGVALVVASACTVPGWDRELTSQAQQTEPVEQPSVLPERETLERDDPARESATVPAAFEKIDAEVDRRIVPGDTIRVFVMGSESLSREFLVPSTGRIAFPPVPETITLAGRTTDDVATAIRDGLKASGELIAPHVSVDVTDPAPRRFYVLGGVTKPQDYAMPFGRSLRLSQAIAMAGGIVDDADREHIAIIREPREEGGPPARVVVDLVRILDFGQLGLDLAIEPNDTIHVPKFDESDLQIFVLGHVNKPGAYRVTQDSSVTVAKAIALAGGESKYARSSRILVVREKGDTRKVFTIDLEEALKDATLDLMLEPRDTVWVPAGVF